MHKSNGYLKMPIYKLIVMENALLKYKDVNPVHKQDFNNII